MNIVYNASAGTGKTYQVTSLYEKLVMEEGIDPRKILLMTFTDNAASELRMRVAHRFQKARRTAEQADHFDTAERAITAMSRLPSAPIGTIHGFCTRLLREHALEAGLSPGFAVLIGDEREELLRRICREELLKKLDADANFRNFCSGMQMIGTGKGFGSSITNTVPKLIGDAGSLGIALDRAASMLPEPQPPVSIVDFIQICNELKSLAKQTKKIKEAIQALENALEQTQEPERLIELFDQNFSGHFSYGEAKTIYPRFKELKEETGARERYRQRFPAARSFAEYLQAVSTRFKQTKHDMDSVDFDDQLQMAAELLTSGKAKPEFQYVIVDEVQDTSRIQCDLIKSLWQNPEEPMEGRVPPRPQPANDPDRVEPVPPLKKPTNLVICGDKKQSIYTWRGADPQVMPDLEEAILKRENSRLENLQTSYRSKAPILDVVNTLFSDVYGAEEYAEGDQLEANAAFKTDDEKPCVEFLEFDDDEDLDKSDKVACEMEAVANRIQLLANGSNDWKPAYRHSDSFLPTSGTNDYRYSDVLILLRRTTHQSVLEQALRHAGIPYTLGGKGRGLFARQETRDVSLFLNAITNPDDAYSLIGFLRSPWIGLSDEAIAELAWSDDGFSIDHLTKHFAPICTGRDACATRAAGISACPSAELVLRYRNLSGTKLASELVRQLIEETGYDALLAGLPRGTQRLANLRKVLDWLRETERGAQTTPAMVARKLAEQIASPPQVPEAALLDPAQNAVTIMTVHGSKGLTKRVVVIPDCSFQPDSDRDFARIFLTTETQRHGDGETSESPSLRSKNTSALGIRITAPDKSKAESPGFKAANDRAKLVREHELKNLFYVAMTRARDLVITSGTIGRNPSGWMKSLVPMIGKEIPAIPYSTLAAEAVPAGASSFSIPTQQQLAGALATLPVAPAVPTLQRLPATRFAKEQDELEPELQYETSNFQSLENSAALGSLGHAVLEQLALNQWAGDVFQWLEKLRDEFGVSKAAALALADRIENARSQMIVATTGMSELRPEFPFVLLEDRQLIDGTVDLLCRTPNGYAIFDYKFTEGTNESVAAKYQGQMNIYRKAADRLFPHAAEASTQLVVISCKGTRFVTCM